MTDSGTCSICLERLKSPVVIPCGHVHCEKCLTVHIQSGQNAIHSQCPTCRTKFSVATPDLRYVPEKYHEFMVPSVRRVFVDIPSVAAYADHIKALEKRVSSLQDDKTRLMTRCESLMAGNKAIAQKEKAARLEKNDVEVALSAAQRTMRDLEKEIKSTIRAPVRSRIESAVVTSPTFDVPSLRPKRKLPMGTRRTIINPAPILRLVGDLDDSRTNPPPTFRKRARLSEPIPHRH